MQRSTVGTGVSRIPLAAEQYRKSLFDSFFPQATNAHRVLASILFILVIFGCAKARFYLPDNPTPITLQTLGVLLAGSVMGWRWGIATVMGYLAIGALGLPFFANEAFELKTPAEGWEYVTGVTGGYLIGFVLAAGASGLLSQLGFTHANSIWAHLTGNLLIYLPALIWLSALDFGWPAEGQLFQQAMYVFIPGDLVKILGASLVAAGIWSYIDSRDADPRNM